MSEKRRRPARLEIGLEVVRTPQTIFEEEAHGKAIRRPMRGGWCISTPGAGSISWLSRCAGKPSKETFQGVEA